MRRYFASIKQYSWVVLVCLVLSVLGGLYLSKIQSSVYSVNSVFVVTQYYTGGPINTATTTASSLLDVANNYATEISTRDVMGYIAQKYPQIGQHRYNANDLIADVVAAPGTTSPTVTLTATASRPDDAVLLANSVADGFASYIQSQLQAQLDGQRKDLQGQLNFYQTDSGNLAKQILSYPTTDP